jgi:hypothetical protein
MKKHRTLSLCLGTLTGLAALSVELPTASDHGVALIGRAEAIIGRPLTPMSYAGVARRTTRRTYAAGAAAGAVYAAPVVITPRPGCYQAVDAYGRVYWRCP